MLPFLQSAEVRRDHAADGPAVGGAVGVPSDIAEDGAHIQASPATDAVQGVALFGIGQEFGATVVEQHDVPLDGAVGFAGLPRSTIKRVVAGDRLARPGRGQERQEQREIFELGQNLLNAQQGDHDPGQG